MATLTHNGFGFEGHWSSPVFAPAENYNSRTHFAGVHGVSEIRLGRGGRGFAINLWHYGGFTNETDIEASLQTIEKHANANGDLVLNNNLQRTYKDVTFEGFAILDGPKRDVAGTLGGKWWVELELYFIQLSVEQG